MLSFTVAVEQELCETGSRRTFFVKLFKYWVHENYICQKEGYWLKIFIKTWLKYVNYDWRMNSLEFGYFLMAYGTDILNIKNWPNAFNYSV